MTASNNKKMQVATYAAILDGVQAWEKSDVCSEKKKVMAIGSIEEAVLILLWLEPAVEAGALVEDIDISIGIGIAGAIIQFYQSVNQ